MRSLRSLALTAALTAALWAALVSGCSKSSATDDPPAPPVRAAREIPAITVDDLDARLAKGDCRAVDANGEATRKRYGVIPGAVLLSDSETFLPRELPEDKAKGLVFYCTNEHCGASHEAAGRAITAGYTNVKVLPVGIAGWAKAGKQTAKL